MKRVMLWRKLLMIGSTHLGHCLIDLEQKLRCNFVWLGFLQCPSCAHVFSNASHGLLDRGERTLLKWSSRTTRTFILSIVDVYDENEVHVDLLNELYFLHCDASCPWFRHLTVNLCHRKSHFPQSQGPNSGDLPDWKQKNRGSGKTSLKWNGKRMG